MMPLASVFGAYWRYRQYATVPVSHRQGTSAPTRSTSLATLCL